MIPNYDKEYFKDDSNLAKGAQAFTVGSDPLIMQRLSSSIYMRPIEAVVRELSTNAYDSHVENNNTNKPFEVHLPVENEYYFSIRDFGTGMSKETLTGIFTTYGESTRRESNDFVGSIGAGSKSPLAYTDQFTVTSYYNGKEITAFIFKNDVQVPLISILSENSTTEPNGVLVTIPVKEIDVQKFSEAAKKVYSWFQVKPTCNIQLNYIKRVPVDKDGKYEKIENGLFVVMGQVAYECPWAKDLMRLAIHADIGSYEINMGRETIQETDGNKLRLHRESTNYLLLLNEKFKELSSTKPYTNKQELINLHSTIHKTSCRSSNLPKDNNSICINRWTGVYFVSSIGNNWQISEYSRGSKQKFNTPAININHPVARRVNSYKNECAAYFANNPQVTSVNIITGDVVEFCKTTGYPISDIVDLSSLTIKKKHVKKDHSKDLWYFDGDGKIHHGLPKDGRPCVVLHGMKNKSVTINNLHYDITYFNDKKWNIIHTDYIGAKKWAIGQGMISGEAYVQLYGPSKKYIRYVKHQAFPSVPIRYPNDFIKKILGDTLYRKYSYYVHLYNTKNRYFYSLKHVMTSVEAKVDADFKKIENALAKSKAIKYIDDSSLLFSIIDEFEEFLNAKNL